MRSIEVSEEVWQAIADRGKFGETADDVLRRIFSLPISSSETPITGSSHRQGAVPRQRRAKKRLSSYISGNHLYLSFEGGPSASWSLPPKTDKIALRSVRDGAVKFARDNSGTNGQIGAVKKTLTDEGYHLMR